RPAGGGTCGRAEVDVTGQAETACPEHRSERSTAHLLLIDDDPVLIPPVGQRSLSLGAASFDFASSAWFVRACSGRFFRPASSGESSSSRPRWKAATNQRFSFSAEAACAA